MRHHLSSSVLLRLLVLAATVCLTPRCSSLGSPEAYGVGPAEPPALRWSEFVRQIKGAGCVTTNCAALRRFYDTAAGSCFHHQHGGRADGGKGVCCKPVALVTTRTTDCQSCDHVWGRLMHAFAAEMSLLSEYVTFVDGGDPMMDQLTRFPYPLPLPFTQEQLLAMEDFSALRGFTAATSQGESAMVARHALPPLLHLRVSNATNNASVAEELAARAALSPEDREDLLAHETALRRRAAYAAAHPPMLQSHQWEPYLRKAFAGQGDYVFRAVFLFPHNGSVMRDVLNEDVAEGVDSNIHFFSSTGPFFAATKKAIRVFDDVMRREAMSHCT